MELKTITSIQEQKRNKERYNLYLDGEFAFSCQKEIVKKLKLKEGVSLEEEKLAEIIHENDLKEAFHQALDHLSYRQRTRQEMIIHLEKKGYGEDIVQEALAKLDHYQFIDDEKYAQDYIDYKGKSQLKGSNRIRQELTLKGVEKEIIEDGLKNYHHEEELENCCLIAKQFFMSKKSLPYNQIKGKLTTKLAGKGYSFDLIHEAIKFLDSDQEVQEIIYSQEDEYFTKAYELAEKSMTKYEKKAANPFQLKMKLVAALKQKGFDQQIIERVLNKLFEG